MIIVQSLCCCALCRVVPKVGLVQDFEINHIEINQGKIPIHDEFLDTVGTHSYTVSVYCTKDNLIAPLQNAGDDFALAVPNIANVGTMRLFIPTSVKPGKHNTGKNYCLRCGLGGLI